MAAAKPAATRIAFFIKSLQGGGVQRATTLLASELVRRGHEVDMVYCAGTHGGEDSFAALRDPAVRLVPLPEGGELAGRWAALRAHPRAAAYLARPVLLPRKPVRAIAQLPALVAYLQACRPRALISATSQLNIAAVLARRLAGWRGRLLLTERTAPSALLSPAATSWRARHLPALMAVLYSEADAIVAVSEALALDLARTAAIPRERIAAIYNPIVGDDVAAKTAEPVDHPWLAAASREPVVLGMGRLEEQKDFPTLVRAFARLRRRRPARLVILGGARTPEQTASRRAELLELAQGLGVAADIDLPGFVTNPFAWLARASVFALSSRYEGLAAVIVQAMACGCPVVSTDCPVGPAEILDHGRLGRLVPVGDDAALATALAATLDEPPPVAALRARAAGFTIDRAADRYLTLIG